MLRRAIHLCLGLIVLPCSLPAGAAEWLTVHGFPGMSQTDLIEVDPTPLEAGEQPVVQLRVSRREMRTSFQGHPYRSYTGTAVIDCTLRQGWYRALTYYQQPEWQGPVTAREDYAPQEARVRFKDVPGYTAQKIVHAACQPRTGR